MKEIKIIAELAWGHDGDINQAINLLRAAKDAGADLFSIHITDIPTYMVKYYGNGEGKVSAGRESLDVYNYLEKINISEENWLLFSNEAKKIDLPLCVMPNDFNSLAFSEKSINPEYYVVSAACFVEEEFLRSIARTGKKTFFRIGGAYLGEIEKAINIFKEEKNAEIVLLHGFQNYPTKLEETNLAFLTTLKNLFNLEVGLADHIDGGDELAAVIPMISISYGATYIEKHITLDRNQKSEDFESALDPQQFAKMVGFIKSAQVAVGDNFISELSPATIRYRNVSRKRIVASKNLAKGERIQLHDLSFKRCDIGLTPDCLDKIVGRVLLKDINADDAINYELF
jgi:sialic acid synthase SpsE